MHAGIRLMLALLAGLVAAVLGFGAVALTFALLSIDVGIGGGLIALLVGMVGASGATIKTFGKLSRDQKQ